MKIKIDPLDKLFSKYIRLRDGKCMRCGNKNTILQCMHFHGRRKKTVRWDEDNACAGCYGCHSYLDSNPLEKISFFQNLLGKEKFMHLNIRATSTHPKPDKAAIELYLKQKIQELDNLNLIVPEKER
jgi:hypothetical protein